MPPESPVTHSPEFAGIFPAREKRPTGFPVRFPLQRQGESLKEFFPWNTKELSRSLRSPTAASVSRSPVPVRRRESNVRFLLPAFAIPPAKNIKLRPYINFPAPFSSVTVLHNKGLPRMHHPVPYPGLPPPWDLLHTRCGNSRSEPASCLFRSGIPHYSWEWLSGQWALWR